MGSGMAILGGALQGIGAGLQQEIQNRREDERTSATQRFQAYLAGAKTDADNAAAARDHQYDLERDAAQAGFKADQAKADAAATAARDKAKYGYDVSLEGVKAKNDAALAQMKSKFAMDEEQAKIAAQMKADVARMGKEVGQAKVTSDGRMILYAKDGSVLRASQPGTFNPPATAQDDTLVLGDRAADNAAQPAAAPAAPAAAPRPAPKPTPKPAAPKNRPPLSSFDSSGSSDPYPLTRSLSGF